MPFRPLETSQPTATGPTPGFRPLTEPEPVFTPAPTPTIFDRAQGFSDGVNDIGGEFLKGVGKGAASTLKGIDTFARKIPGVGSFLNKVNPIKPDEEADRILTQPSNNAQAAGFTAEQIAEFLIPSAYITKAQKAAQGAVGASKILPKAAKPAASLFAKAGVEGAAAGVIRTAQTGDAGQGAEAGLYGGLLSAGTQLLGKAARGLGSKIQDSVIKPSIRDVKDGFNIKNVQKYDVGGSLNDTLTKTNRKMNDLSRELTEKLKAHPRARIDLNDIYDKTVERLGGEKAKLFGTSGRTDGALAELKDEIARFGEKSVDLVTANTVKRAAGTQGAWQYGIPDPSAAAREKVYDTFYNEMKVAIERASPGGVKEINRQLSDLIPIHNAVVRRIPVAERNNAIGLDDAIGLFMASQTPAAIPVVVTNKLMKSGKFGNMLSKVGTRGPVSERLFGK
ncbi:MAG: hypothetical protein Q8L86_12550 [Vicinamibacterales bacterium]|nr:hypothetical protein [Vicinamibacterales bacterium]